MGAYQSENRAISSQINGSLSSFLEYGFLEIFKPNGRACHISIVISYIDKSKQGSQLTKNSQKIRFFRERIPAFECKPGCHDCCEPITASSEGMARFPVKSDEEHESALAEQLPISW